MDQLPMYNPVEIEPKWQARWEADGLYHAEIDPKIKKFYALTMLPYTSGDLHIGHWYPIGPSDARARFKRMQGFNVLFPIGFDAFGLPAENAAIKNNIHPKQWTYKNINNMRRQLKTMGAMFDWRREVITADPKYYRWTQWFFIQLFERGLAYRKYSPVDWCPNCNTTLAREQVWGEDRHCERCQTPVIKKDLEQWFLKITSYAEQLLNFDAIDWPERVRTLQTNWIGKSEGALVTFHTEQGEAFEIFTTRPDTLWGVSFMVLAPEHPLVEKITTSDHKKDIDAYRQKAARQSDIQREATDKEKTGVFTGGYAINPVNQARIPIWIADYVLMTYGTGAIMAVPGHDQRDFEFALKFGLPIIPVIARQDGVTKSTVKRGVVKPGFADQLKKDGYRFLQKDGSLLVTLQHQEVDDFIALVKANLMSDAWVELVGFTWKFIFSDEVVEFDSVKNDQVILKRCQALEPGVGVARTVMEMLSANKFYENILLHADYGDMIHSGNFSGAKGATARYDITKWLEKQGWGKGAVNYKLRDWLISRQRYWGAPIPIIYCQKCGAVPVPEEDLPVLLPDDVEWKPTGESPLKLHPTWRYTTCPKCNGKAERETDTMDTFMCSSWYHLRYLSPDYDQGPFDQKEYDYWMPVDAYTGGIEHATMHLIYTRFFHKAARDCEITEGDEPMLQLRNQGMVLGEDFEKMSKSRGNVIAPDKLIKVYGADTMRAYLMFFARWDQGGPWSSTGIEGTSRWIKRSWVMVVEPPLKTGEDPNAARSMRRKLHQTLISVTRDYETFEFNTIISALMELSNEMIKAKPVLWKSPVWQEAVEIYLKMLAPVAPHISEELWNLLGKPYSIHQQAWPVVDEQAALADEIVLVLQVNGKLRDRITVAADISDEDSRKVALSNEQVIKHLEGKTPRQVIVVSGKLVNVVI
ncbi:MAG: class I tRNA ligase family protein [Anaerolineaceae bacterium]